MANSRRTLPLAIAALLVLALGLTGCARGRGEVAGGAPAFVALGASDAVGIGALRPPLEGWVPVVAAGLPEGTRVVNLGVSGATLGEVIGGQLPIALDAAPRWVALWPGPNDFRNGVALATFAAQLEQIVAALRPEPGQRRTVVLLNLPDLRAVPAFGQADPATLDRRVREWNGAIAAVAARHADYTLLVDLHADWAELATRPELLSGDGFHPSTAGYRRIADLTLGTLRRDDPALAR